MRRSVSRSGARAPSVVVAWQLGARLVRRPRRVGRRVHSVRRERLVVLALGVRRRRRGCGLLWLRRLDGQRLLRLLGIRVASGRAGGRRSSGLRRRRLQRLRHVAGRVPVLRYLGVAVGGAVVEDAPVEVVGVVVPRARLLRLSQRDAGALAHVLDVGRALGDVLDAHLIRVRVWG